MDAPETIILEDNKVQISNVKAKFGVNTFYINNMSTVSIYEKKPPRVIFIIISLVGLYIAWWAFSKYGYTNFTAYLGLIVVLFGAVMAIFPKMKYIVRVVSSGVASDCLETTNHKYAQQVVDAINKALQMKGL